MLYNLSGFPIVLFGIYDVNLIATRIDLFIVYRLLLVLEMIGIFYALTVGLIACKIIYESNVFHHNFTNVLVVFLVEHALSQVGRGILMGYQYGVFKITGEICSDLPLFFLSLFRFFVYAAALLILGNMVIERSMAIFFIKDYESVGRPWLQWFIHINTTATQLSAVFIYSIATCLLNGLIFKYLVAMTFLWIISTLPAFLFVSHLNAKFLRFLLSTFDLKIYTLSRRFQLEENQKALMLMKNIFIGHFVFCFFGLSIFAIPRLIFSHGSPEMELSIGALEAAQSVYGMVFISSLIYMVPSWRNHFCRYFKRYQKDELIVIKKLKRERIISTSDVGNFYFQELNRVWSG